MMPRFLASTTGNTQRGIGSLEKMQQEIKRSLPNSLFYISSSLLHTLNTPLLLCIPYENVSLSIVADFLWPHGLQPIGLLCPLNSQGKNTGVGSQSLLQGIFLTQGSNPGLLHCRQILYHLSNQGSPTEINKTLHSTVQSSLMKMIFRVILLDFWRFSLLEIKARKSYFYSRSTGQLSIPLKLISAIRICLFVCLFVCVSHSIVSDSM